MTAAAISLLDQAGRLRLLALVAFLMVVPVIVLRAIAGHEWDPGDMVFLGILVAGLTIALEVAARLPQRRAYGAGLGLALFAGLAQIWVNLAVGIIGSEDNPINLIYAAVIVIAVITALFFGFRAAGMAKAMVATALAQGAAFLAALASGSGFTGPITIFFVSLWLISAWLFRRAEGARRSRSP